MPNLNMGLCGKLAKGVIVGVYLLRWIVTYPVGKVIHSLNNWGLTDSGNLRRLYKVTSGPISQQNN